MNARRKWLLDYLVFLAVRSAVALLQALPIGAAARLAEAFAWLAYRVDRRHRAVARGNLRQAYPMLSEAQRERLVRATYRHFCLMIVEMVFLPRKLQPSNWRRYLDLAPGETVVRALLSGRPTIVVTGHYGNWEMAGYALALFGFKSAAVARPLDNPYLDDLVRRFRQKTGQQLLNKKGDFERTEQILKAGGILCTLGDQDAGQGGLFVDFFGRPASTHKAIALLALHHDALILVAAARRAGPVMRYRLEAAAPIDPRDYANQQGGVQALTQRFTHEFEEIVRLDPRQYLWLHRRWKSVPRARPRAAAA
jgi:KDO2-lipid IV(A) lauroyltransferase